MQSLNTLALVKGTFFSVSVLFDLSPNKKNKKNNNKKNNKVKCKLTLRVSKNLKSFASLDTPKVFGLMWISLIL